MSDARSRSRELYGQDAEDVRTCTASCLSGSAGLKGSVKLSKGVEACIWVNTRTRHIAGERANGLIWWHDVTLTRSATPTCPHIPQPRPSSPILAQATWRRREHGRDQHGAMAWTEATTHASTSQHYSSTLKHQHHHHCQHCQLVHYYSPMPRQADAAADAPLTRRPLLLRPSYLLSVPSTSTSVGLNLASLPSTPSPIGLSASFERSYFPMIGTLHNTSSKADHPQVNIPHRRRRGSE